MNVSTKHGVEIEIENENPAHYLCFRLVMIGACGVQVRANPFEQNYLLFIAQIN